MTKLAIVLDGSRKYEILRLSGLYYVNFGGSLGFSGPLSFSRDTEAIKRVRNAILSGELRPAR